MGMNTAVLYEINKPLVVDEKINVLDPGFEQVLVEIHVNWIYQKQLKKTQDKRGVDPFLQHLLYKESTGVVKVINPGITTISTGNPVVISWIKDLDINSHISTYYKRDRLINARYITTFNEYIVASEYV